MKADVLLFAMSDVSRDARTLNLARAIAATGLSVAVAASCSLDWSDAGITMLKWDDPGGSALSRWLSFRQWAASLSIQPRVVAAMDFFALASAVRSAKRANVKLIYDMREFYFALGPLEGKGLRQRLISIAERWWLRSVSRIIVAGRLDARIVQKRFRLSDTPYILTNTPPYREAVVSDKLRKLFSIQSSDIIVIYQGVVHPGRGLVPFINAMALMPDVHLCIVGDGPALSEIRTYAESDLVANRVHFHPSVPYDLLHPITCSADIGLCLIEPVSLSYEYALPNKFFEYMMARIPSVVSDLPALHDQILQTPVGMLVERSLKPDDICAAIEQLRNTSTRQAMIQACGAIRDLCYERQAVYAVDVFRECMT
ncbi:MAG: glycosyltransferase [Ignavibacteria bacterium]|nr:glycosyltransferase [Ignavibacteria bacterium]